MSDMVQTFDDLPDDVLGGSRSDNNTDDECKAPVEPKVVNISTASSSTAQSPLSKAAKSATPSHNAAKSVEERPQIDLSGVKPGVSIIHKAFGKGIVTKIGADRIHVSFGKAEKMFQYPSSFENRFLQLNVVVL
jgi:hypothetical protein